MDTTPNLNELLDNLGFDPSQGYRLPDDLNELSTSSLKGFIEQSALCHSAESHALIHITGPSVRGHSVPVRGLGEFITALQTTFDSIGASIEGFRSTTGSIPSSFSARTELSLTASPLPGSVILEITPSVPRLEDLYPDGDALFDIEEAIGAKPLADSAFEELSELLEKLDISSPDQNDFVDRLSELGPRVASSLKGLCDGISKASIDIDFEWEEPSKPKKAVNINRSFARYISEVIDSASITSNEARIEGILLTVTTSDKDHLRIRQQIGDVETKEVTLPIGDISQDELRDLHAGDRVVVYAEQQISTRAGGRTVTKLKGLSIERIQSKSGS